MKNVLFVICSCLIVHAGAIAQTNVKRTVASPYDNWYVGGSAGVQTYIGNELLAAARWNKVDFTANAEGGCWVAPILGLGIQVSYFTLSSQTNIFMYNPYVPSNYSVNKNGYVDFRINGIKIGANALIEWTNLVQGYRMAQYRRTHFSTPVEFGFACAFGPKVNPWTTSYPARSGSLFGSVGFQAEYHINNHLLLTGTLKGTLVGKRFDLSPLVQSNVNVDIMPSLTVGIRYNIFDELFSFQQETVKVPDVRIEEHAATHPQTIQNRRMSFTEDSLFAIFNAISEQSSDNSERVTFSNNRFTLNLSERVKLNIFVSGIQEDEFDLEETSRKEPTYIIIAGRSADDNPNLSANRCNSIVNTLIQNGLVFRESFRTYPLGEVSNDYANEAYILPISKELLQTLKDWEESKKQ